MTTNLISIRCLDCCRDSIHLDVEALIYIPLNRVNTRVLEVCRFNPYQAWVYVADYRATSFTEEAKTLCSAVFFTRTPTGQVMEAFGTLVSNVQVALGQVRGVTCLPLPPDPRAYANGSASGDESQQQQV